VEGLNAEYKAALSCFTITGSHSSNFINWDLWTSDGAKL